MAALFGFSIFKSLLAFTGLGLIFFLVGYFVLYILAQRKDYNQTIPIGAFIGTVATAWALALGFVAADIWANSAKAEQATIDERSAIERLIGIAGSPEINAVEMRKALLLYRKAVMDDEWTKNINLRPATSVEAALQTIRDNILALGKSDIAAPIVAHVLNDFDILQDARNTRLAVGRTSIDAYKWYLVLILTAMTIITIAATHADRRRAGNTALTIFSCSATLCLWILAIHANPYQGLEKLEPTLLLNEASTNQ
ncbi:bestrophin-like domain [Ochrobactrum sp. MYb379]|uniref:bestrophin-like domain n=1 Tax=Ochrobactrum sp. MYb379 TaxID=2745275 RepID=UPI0030B608FC